MTCEFKGLTFRTTKRTITKIILHCAATMPSMDIGVKEITKWHKARGFRTIGYHDVIRRNGTLEYGRDLNKIGAHVRGHNVGSIGICMAGGVDKFNDPEDNFTEAQWKTLRLLLEYYDTQFPKATIHGHNEFANKACPSFDVQKELKNGRLKGIK